MEHVIAKRIAGINYTLNGQKKLYVFISGFIHNSAQFM